MKRVRLIDANALKYKNLAEVNGRLTHVLTAEEIDNAPEVTPSLNLDNITEEDIEKFKTIWQRANSKGLLIINENKLRNKWGKWVISEIQCPNCLEYFQTDCYSMEELNKCPSCGEDLRGGAEQ